MSEYADLVAFGLDCGQAARRIAGEREYLIHQKPDGSPVTTTDLAIQRAFDERVRALWPRHSVRGEEGGFEVPDPEVIWIVDPLDGTTAYMYGMPTAMFAAAAVCARSGQVLAAAISNLELDIDYWATIDGGAYRNGEEIRASTRTLQDGLRIGGTSSNIGRAGVLSDTYYELTPLPDGGTSRRRVGIAPTVFKGCQVAEGHIDVAAYKGIHPHDVAAAGHLVARAGGVVMDLRGEEHDYLSRRVNGAVLLNNASGVQEVMLDELANVIAS